MSIKSKAVFFVERNKVELRDIELPDPATGDIVVRTLYSGISPGTELWSLTGKYWSTKFPTIPGYQKVGVVEQTGSDVKNFKEGDVVFLRFTNVMPGTEIEWAGHTGYSVISADTPELFKIPEGLDPAQGSLLCMPAIGYHGAAEVMPIEENECVVVIGLGLIGQFSAQAAKLRGAKVIGIDLLDNRLKLAADYADAITINPLKEDSAEVIKKHCPDGVDAVIDTSAHVDTINASFHWLRNGGRYCFQGYYPDKTPLDLLWPHAKELVMYNPTNCTLEGEMQCAKHIVEGTMHIESMITHVVSADEAPKMYQLLLDNPKDAMGVVLNWQ